MAKRVFILALMLICGLMFPIALLYECFEIVVIIPIYWVIKGEEYLKQHKYFFYAYADFLSSLVIDKKIEKPTLKRKYWYE